MTIVAAAGKVTLMVEAEAKRVGIEDAETVAIEKRAEDVDVGAKVVFDSTAIEEVTGMLVETPAFLSDVDREGMSRS